MNTIKILMFTLLTFLSNSVFAQENTKHHKVEQLTYSCPMKCEGDKTYHKEGKCPKCGMTLKEMKVIVYACPMNCEGEKTYNKEGKCPQCGMKLKEKKTIAFACPMKCEGEKIYYKESKCPQCGMKLKEVNFSNSKH